jgi:hypothetical protein
MGAIRHILPYLILLFFIIKGNKQFFFFLAVPFLIFMSNSIFFENVKPFQMPGSLQNILIFIWLVLLWLASKIVTKQRVGKHTFHDKLNATDLCILALLLISTVGLIRTVTSYYPLIQGVIQEFFLQTSLLFAYFMIKDWFSSSKTGVIVEFLYAIVVVNSLAALLFLLHQGFHFNIYTTEEYLSESFDGQEITRSFWFMPQFLFFSVAFLLVFKKKYPLSIPLLIINLSAIVITYTISAIIITMLIIILYFLLAGLKDGRLGPTIGNLFKYAIMAIAGFLLMWKLLPANINYLISRVSEHTESEYTKKEQNDMEVRFTNTRLMISKIDRDKIFLGMGPVTEYQSPKVAEMKGNTADIAWSGVIFYWGFIGLSIFALIFLFSSFQAFNFFMKFDGITSDLALMLLLFIISQFIDSFDSWTFLSAHGVAVGLWYFALMSALPKLYKRNQIVEIKNSLAPVYS